MTRGFRVSARIDRPAHEVWAFLTNFENAEKWMTGVDDMRPVTPGPPRLGARLKFKARGRERESKITAWDPCRRIALTSTRGGITATYEYSLSPASGSTQLTLEAACQARGFWKLLHPLIVLAMKRNDSTHLAKLKNAIEG